MDLVEVNRKDILTDSHLVARKFGYKHANLVRIIKNVMETVSAFKGDLKSPLNMPKVDTEERVYRGTDYTSYLMNRQFFSLLVMRMSGKKAFEWQVKFNNAFYEMERRLLKVETNRSDIEWNSSRLIGKTARLEETDAIKEFVEYATKQGSTKAKFYYKHITDASYKALGLMSQRNPKLRDEMGIYELSELMLAERLAANKLKQYMDLGRHYKDIYTSVRDDLIVFSNSMKLS